MDPTDLITVAAAAELRGVSERRIRQFIAEKRLPAQKVGRDWLLDRRDVRALKRLKPGRKPNPTVAG